MDASAPLVSVYLPTHNRSRLVRRAIQSVIEQTYRPLEILVCDDASSDDTKQVIGELQSQSDVPIRYFRNETPQGACAARNVCIKAAQGKFITGLDDDDTFHRQRIELLMKYYDSIYSGIASTIRNCLDESELKKTDDTPAGKEEVLLVGNNRMLFANVLGSQLLMETERFRRINGFDATFKAWQDYDAWVRIIDAYGPAQLLLLNLYNSDFGHEGPRITTSTNRLIGARQFADKHRAKMSPAHRRNFELVYALMSNQRLSWGHLISNFERSSWKIWVKLVLRSLQRKGICHP